MFTVHNDSLHRPSERAEHAFKQQQLFNRILTGLMILLAGLGVWNILELAALIRSDAQDLADISSILNHPSSRIIFLVAFITLVVYLYKEIKWGDAGFAMSFFLAPLLFFALVPVMSAEVQPAEENMAVKITLNYCEPGAIEGGEVLNNDACTLVDPASQQVFLTESNPMEGDPEWLSPNSQDDFGSSWSVQARGEFRVYFLLAQDSMEHCESAPLTSSEPSPERLGHSCLEQDGQAWMVQPYETNTAEGGRLIVYQEAAP